MREAFGAFLRSKQGEGPRWDWRWWCTLTFPGTPGRGQADAAWRRWIQYLGELYSPPEPPRYVRAIELQKRGSLHFHALVDAGAPASRMDAKRRWERCSGGGFARVWPYDPELGAAAYLAKYLQKGPFELDLDGLSYRIQAWGNFREDT